MVQSRHPWFEMWGYAPSSVTGLDFEAALRYEAAFVKRRDLPYTRHSYGLQNTLTPSWSASTLEYPKVGADDLCQQIP